GEAFVVAPLTSDVHSLGTLLDAMAPDTMPVGGDDAAAAIARGAALIRDAKVGGGSLVLIADTAGTAAQAAARQARSEGVRVSVLGVDTAHGCRCRAAASCTMQRVICSWPLATMRRWLPWPRRAAAATWP